MKRLMLIALLFPVAELAAQNTFPSSGNTGIGTLSPTSFLQVVGNSTSFPELRLDHYQSNMGSSTLSLRRSRGTLASPAAVIDQDYLMSLESWAYIGTDFTRNAYIASQANGSNTALGTPTDLIFATSSGGADAIEGMRLDKSGNLGIGTSLPTEKLSVKGKIRAQEVKVELSNWPDFVFFKAYTLPTIQETEKFIKANGHLPGIPSAEEAVKNGIELGDMNKKLLQKIEELTLYLIDQAKDISDLKKQNESLVKKIEKITQNQ